jgi:putative membrane protein insertion efficiency factor
MPALRQSLKRPRFWIFSVVAVALAVAAITDWTKPAQTQSSVQYYNRAVFTGYFQYVRPFTSRFVHCRFYPTCSIYSVMAMQTYGFPKGLWLTVKRLCRCLPWVPMGTYDPVPPRAIEAAPAATNPAP